MIHLNKNLSSKKTGKVDMNINKLLIYFGLILPSINSYPHSKKFNYASCRKLTEPPQISTHVLLTDLEFNSKETPSQSHCHPKPNTVVDMNSNARFKREPEHSSVVRSWMGFQASYAITLISVFLLVLNILLLLYVLITQCKSKSKKDNVSGEDDTKPQPKCDRLSTVSSSSSTTSMPRLSDEYPSSESDTEGNENSSEG